MNNNLIQLALTEVYERVKCQEFVSDKVLCELQNSVASFSGTQDQALVEKWLSYIKDISRDALMLRIDRDKAHFSMVHDALCDCLNSYLHRCSG